MIHCLCSLMSSGTFFLSQELSSVTGKPLSVMNLQPLLQRTPDLMCALSAFIDAYQLEFLALPTAVLQVVTAFSIVLLVGSWPLPFSLGQSFDEVPFSENGRNQQNHKRAVAASFLAATGITHSSRRPLQLHTISIYLYIYISIYYLYLYIYIYIYIYIYLYLYISLNIYMYLIISIYTYINLFISKYIYKYLYIYIHIYLYVFIYIIYIYTSIWPFCACNVRFIVAGILTMSL